MIELIPLTTLAAILLMIAYNMGEWKQFTIFSRASKADTLILWATFLSTVLVGLVFAVEIGMILAAFIHLNRVAEASGMEELKTSTEQEEDPRELELIQALDIPPEVEVYEIYGSLFFAAMEKFMMAQSRLKRMPRVLILRMRHVMTIDASGIQLLTDFLNQARRAQTLLLISGVKKRSEVYQTLEKSHFVATLGSQHLFSSLGQAVAYAKQHLHTTEQS